MKKILIIIGIFSLTITSLIYIYQNFFNEKRINEKKAKTYYERITSFKQQTEIKDGDLIFQTSLSEQSKAIQLATNSKYSHCGIIFNNNGQLYVFEAIQPVKKTPLDEWIARGKDGHYVIKRLKNANQILTTETIQKMKQQGRNFESKNYDLTFEWSDHSIYCSELIWKIYKRATGIELGNLEKLSDFDLTNKVVKQKMKERYADKIPMNELVISPNAIFNSELLETIEQN